MTEGDPGTPTEWRMAYIANEQGDADEQPKLTINGLGPADYDQLKADNALVRDYGQVQRLIDAVGLNLGDFLRAIVERAAKFLERRSLTHEEFDELSNDFSRLLVNLLSMFRILLEHVETSTCRTFGPDSEELARWKRATAREYDNHWEYRLYYGLRNYCLHVGMPPLRISYSSSVDTEAITFSLNLVRDELLSERSCWNKKLISDLESSEPEIPVLMSMDPWSECFWRVAHEALLIQRDASLEAAHRILQHRLDLELPKDVGEVCAVLLPITDRPVDSLKFTILHLEERLARKLVEGPNWTPSSKGRGAESDA